jgi:hypothetical protein
VQKETVGLNKGAMGIGTSAVPQENRTPTLADAGIDKKLSSRAQKLASLSKIALLILGKAIQAQRLIVTKASENGEHI